MSKVCQGIIFQHQRVTLHVNFLDNGMVWRAALQKRRIITKPTVEWQRRETNLLEIGSQGSDLKREKCFV